MRKIKIIICGGIPVLSTKTGCDKLDVLCVRFLQRQILRPFLMLVFSFLIVIANKYRVKTISHLDFLLLFWVENTYKVFMNVFIFEKHSVYSTT